MTLAAKPRVPAHHKKRQAGHHRHNKSYLGTYWPYLPMLLIVGAGVMANKVWPASLQPAPGIVAAAEPSSRLQSLAGNQSLGLMNFVIVVTVLAFAVFVVRHWYRLHRFINKGEAFVFSHPLLDIALVLVFTSGVVLTRTPT